MAICSTRFFSSYFGNSSGKHGVSFCHMFSFLFFSPCLSIAIPQGFIGSFYARSCVGVCVCVSVSAHEIATSTVIFSVANQLWSPGTS